jgi:hypothetical protein
MLFFSLFLLQNQRTAVQNRSCSVEGEVLGVLVTVGGGGGGEEDECGGNTAYCVHMYINIK